jgi:G:T/U-mismatch repair DNA glycosylase
MKKIQFTEHADWYIENHPNWYHDIPVMRTLILGSFPPHQKKRDYPFYYPNKQNNFWKILAAICSHELLYFQGEKAVLERKAIMEKLQIGIENMGRSIKRKGESAKDTDIVISDFHDIISIIQSHKELCMIILSGYSAPNSTYRSFCKYLVDKNIPFTVPEKIKVGASFQILIDKRHITCVICHSTSTATRIKLEQLIIEFRSFILQNNQTNQDHS